MLRTFALAAILMSISLPAQAGKICDQPYVPDIKSGVTISKLDLSVMRDDAKAFMDASDLYQDCLTRAALKDPLFAMKADTLKHQNQGDKELVGKRINDMIVTYNASLRANTKTSDARH